jgi:hypothetical protein
MLRGVAVSKERWQRAYESAVRAVIEIIEDPENRDRGKMTRALLDKTNSWPGNLAEPEVLPHEAAEEIVREAIERVRRQRKG